MRLEAAAADLPLDMSLLQFQEFRFSFSPPSFQFRAHAIPPAARADAQHVQRQCRRARAWCAERGSRRAAAVCRRSAVDVGVAARRRVRARQKVNVQCGLHVPPVS